MQGINDKMSFLSNGWKLSIETYVEENLPVDSWKSGVGFGEHSLLLWSITIIDP